MSPFTKTMIYPAITAGNSPPIESQPKRTPSAPGVLVSGIERRNETMTDKTDIYQALNAVMKVVGYVQKQKAPEGGGLRYSFVGEAELIKAIRPAFVEHGIVVHPSTMTNVITDSYTTKNGAVMNRTITSLVYRFAHAPSGTFIDVAVNGEGADGGDKSSNKALTGAFKYALRQTLMIETGDDPDIPDEPTTTTHPIAKAVEKAGQQNGQDYPPMIGAATLTALNTAGRGFYGKGWDDKRPELVKSITKDRATSSKKLTDAEGQKLINGIREKADKKADKGTA